MKDRLRVAMLASNVLRLPPRKEHVPAGWSGAPEWNAYEITEELVRRGVDVTLFASGNSRTSAKLMSVHPIDSYSDPSIGIGSHKDYELKLASLAYQLAKKGEFGVVHSHIPQRSGFFSELVDVSTVATLHSELDNPGILPKMKDSQNYVSISYNQRIPLQDLNYVATIPHGIEVGKMPFEQKKEGHLIYSGRIVPEKGLDHAIEIAKRSGKQLLIFGSPVSEEDSFWREVVSSNIDQENILYIGFVDRTRIPSYLKNASALLFPIQWQEPFGLVMIEAMACGTPVIAYNRGSVPEVVKDGETGFVIQETGNREEDLEAMVRAVNNLDSINPLDCRKHVEQNFSIQKEAESYLRLYGSLCFD